MPFNGSGVYTPPGSSFPAVPKTLIESTKYNAVVNDQSTALSTCVTKDGQTTITANLPMSGFKHTGVAAGSARTEYASLANMQDGTGVYVGTVGGTADVITLTPSPAITVYAAGQQFRWIASGANTGAVTVNVSALGAKSLTKGGSTALVAGDIPSGALVTANYDGTRFQIVSVANLASAGAITASGLTMATSRILGRTTAGTGSVEELTSAQVTAFIGAATTSLQGAVQLATTAEAATGTATDRALTPAALRGGPINSTIRLNTSNGNGSTNTFLRRFTTVVTNVGSDITYADSATLGATFTINNNGVYSIAYSDSATGSALAFGVSINESSNTNVVSLSSSALLICSQSTSANAIGYCGGTFYLAAGSVLRLNTNPAAAGSSTTSGAPVFCITRVA